MQKLRTDALALMSGMDDQFSDVCGAVLLPCANGADDLSAFNRFEDDSAFKLRFQLCKRLYERRNREVLQQNRLALVGEVLEGEDGGKV